MQTACLFYHWHQRNAELFYPKVKQKWTHSRWPSYHLSGSVLPTVLQQTHRSMYHNAGLLHWSSPDYEVHDHWKNKPDFERNGVATWETIKQTYFYCKAGLTFNSIWMKESLKNLELPSKQIVCCWTTCRGFKVWLNYIIFILHKNTSFPLGFESNHQCKSLKSKNNDHMRGSLGLVLHVIHPLATKHLVTPKIWDEM